jgi:hypothetical protein
MIYTTKEIKSGKFYIEKDDKWIAVDLLLDYLNNNSNPCLKCGSVQCAVCSQDLIKLIKEKSEAIK